MVKRISVKHIACLSLLSTSMAHAAERPNIIYIFTDQHTANAMSCAGNPDLHTPNLDRLAAAGIMFQNAYCTAALHAAPCLQDAIQAQQDCWSTVLRYKNRSRHGLWAHW